MKKAIFLDRDGTIIENAHFLSDIKDIQWKADAFKVLKQFLDHGYLLIIITNQSGIARGYFSESDFWDIQHHIEKTLADASIMIHKTYFCPHHPTEGQAPYNVTCTCRKPQPGMVKAAIKEFDIDPKQSWVIGDADRDLEAGMGAGIPKTQCVLVSETYSLSDVAQKVFRN